MTGVEFEGIFADKIDKAYSAYLDPTQENRLFKEALYDTILKTYANLADEDSYNDIASVIRTAQVFNLNNNRIYTSPIPISLFEIAFGSAGSVTTPVPHNLITGDKVKFSGVAGFTTTPAINGTFFAVTVASATQFLVTFSTGSGTWTTNTGQIIETTGADDVSKQVSSHQELLALKAKFNQVLQLSVTDATNTSPIRIKIDKRNNIKTGELINISGVNGNLNANGDRYVKKINTYQFDLYSDKDLTNAVNGNGVFGGAGTINRVQYKSATPFFSSRQISEYSKPSIYSPQFDRADNLLKILPNDSTCVEVTLDYISNPSVTIDVADNAIDLENYFHYDFLIRVIDTAKDMFFARSKDFESLQGEGLLQQVDAQKT